MSESEKVEETREEAGVPAAREAASVPATYDESDDTGFEGTGSEDYVLPFIKLLQKNSPECDEDSSAYVEGAKAGLYYDTASGELLEEVVFIPCFYKRSMVEWKDRETGGGFVAQHEVGYEAQFPRDDRGRWVTEEGNYIADTRYFFGLRVRPDGSLLHDVISFTSTQLKKSRQWLTRMQNMKAKDERTGTMKTMHIFSCAWRFTSVGEENEKGSWKGYKIELIDECSPELKQAAYEARQMFKTASASIKPPADAAEAPF